MLRNLFSLQGALKIVLFSGAALFVFTGIFKPGYEAYKINKMLSELHGQKFESPGEARAILTEKMKTGFKEVVALDGFDASIERKDLNNFVYNVAYERKTKIWNNVFTATSYRLSSDKSFKTALLGD
jgi:hypothetical protein